MLQRGILANNSLLRIGNTPIRWAQKLETSFQLCSVRDDHVAGICAQGFVRYGKVDAGRESITFRANTQISGDITAMDLSPDRTTVAVGFSTGLLKVFSTRNGSMIQSATFGHGVKKIVFTSDVMMVLLNNGVIMYYSLRDRIVSNFELDSVFQIAASSTVTAIITGQRIVLDSDNGLVCSAYPIVITEDDDLRTSSVSVKSIGTHHYVAYCVGHHMTLIKCIIEDNLFMLIWQQSLRFDHPLKNLAIVNVLDGTPLTLALDHRDCMSLVVGTVIVEQGFCADGFMPPYENLKFLPWSLKGYTLLCPATNMSITSIDVADFSEFLEAMISEPNLTGALAYARSIGKALPIFEPSTVPIVAVAIDRIITAGASGVITEQVKKLIEAAIVTIDQLNDSTMSVQEKRTHIGSVFRSLVPNAGTVFFDCLDNVYGKIDLRSLPETIMTTLIHRLVQRQSLDEIKEIMTTNDISNFNLDNVTTILRDHRMWASYVDICCRSGRYAQVFTTFENILQSGEPDQKQIFMGFLRRCLGNGDPEVRKQTMTWLINDDYKVLKIILNICPGELFEVLQDVFVGVSILLQHFVPLMNALLNVVKTPGYPYIVSRKAFELVTTVLELRQFTNVAVFNTLFECLVYLVTETNYANGNDLPAITDVSYDCLNYVINNVDQEQINRLKEAAVQRQSFYVVALCASNQRDIDTLYECLVQESFPFNKETVPFAMNALSNYSDQFKVYDAEFPKKLYERMFVAMPNATVTCLLNFPDAIRTPEFSCELYTALLTKYNQNEFFLSNVTEIFMANFMFSLIERFADQKNVCDQKLCECLLSNGALVTRCSDSDYCLNMASANNLIASKVLLSLGRHLPDVAFEAMIDYADTYQNDEQIRPLVQCVLQYAELFGASAASCELYPKLMTAFVNRVTPALEEPMFQLCENIFLTAISQSIPSAQIVKLANRIASTFSNDRYRRTLSRAFAELNLSVEMNSILYNIVNQEGQQQLGVQLWKSGYEVHNEILCPKCEIPILDGYHIFENNLYHTNCAPTFNA